ncbi:MAG: hypothetical protein PHE89_06935 [Alphaproteobacteria bacterium]|nr:hypothetical protein [Alphaproteobacteria bacterium]
MKTKVRTKDLFCLVSGKVLLGEERFAEAVGQIVGKNVSTYRARLISCNISNEVAAQFPELSSHFRKFIDCCKLPSRTDPKDYLDEITKGLEEEYELECISV